MSRVAFVDGAYVPIESRAIAIEDRGFQFSDGVYEVWSLWDGSLLDAEAHFARLRRSAAAIGLAISFTDAALFAVLRETVRRNRLSFGLVYLQVTRGSAPRDHAFPSDASPTIVVTVRAANRPAMMARARNGVGVLTLPDERWARCDIKSVSLLANVLAKQKARTAGAYEAWLVDAQGCITEGASSAAWIVDKDGVLRTRPLSTEILPSVTREILLLLARERQIPVTEAAFTEAEALQAREAFMSAASGALTPIVRINDAEIGHGRPGPVSTLLREAYFSTAKGRARSVTLRGALKIR